MKDKMTLKRALCTAAAGLAAITLVHTMHGPGQKDIRRHDDSLKESYIIAPGDTFQGVYQAFARDAISYQDFKEINLHLKRDGSFDIVRVGDKVKIPSDPSQSHDKPDLDSIIENIDFKDGDIIGHTSKTDQSRYIRFVTSSDYTHVGMIVNKDESFYVLEAVQPVKYTPLKDWVENGKGSRFTLKRLKGSETHDLSAVVKEAERHLGKDYDLLFSPSDDKMYCSEIIYKAYEKEIGVTLGEYEAFGDAVGIFRFVPPIRKKIKQRWGEVPDEMPVLTPQSLMSSPNLKEVYSNY